MCKTRPFIWNKQKKIHTFFRFCGVCVTWSLPLRYLIVSPYSHRYRFLFGFLNRNGNSGNYNGKSKDNGSSGPFRWLISDFSAEINLLIDVEGVFWTIRSLSLLETIFIVFDIINIRE